jgi:hypothetical protein
VVFEAIVAAPALSPARDGCGMACMRRLTPRYKFCCTDHRECATAPRPLCYRRYMQESPHPSPLSPQAIVAALRENATIESVGLSHVQEGAERQRGEAPRLDPKNPDGHYRLDLAQPWDGFVCEALYDRMQARGAFFNPPRLPLCPSPFIHSLR